MSYRAVPPTDPVTFQWLIDRGLDVGLHCHPCGRHLIVSTSSLPFPPETPIPSLEGRFKCTRCGSTKTEARPEWPSRGR